MGVLILLLGYVLMGVKLWALIDATMRPAEAYVAADTATKPIWLGLLAAAVVTGFIATVGPVRGSFLGGELGLLSLAGLVVALVYLLAVRSRLRDVE
ncbi:MAG: DUF2516 family protein [Actinomycetales bacterium]|nr:DUF2516 family protein [Actinomycetales bacterium]